MAPVGTNFVVTTIAGFPGIGTNDGTGTNAQFFHSLWHYGGSFQ